MESLKDFLTPTTFSFYGYIVAIGCLIGGITFSAITGSLRDKERRNFHCNVGSKSPFNENFLRASCFDQYDQQYNLPLPLYGFVLLSFFILTLISIIYSWCCVKSRVEEVEQACKIDVENPRPRQIFTTRRVFKCYLTQLLIRLILGIVFILLQNFVLYPSGFPTSFDCEMKLEVSKVPESNMTFSNSSFIDCRNSMGSDKDFCAMIVWIVHTILACLVAGEIIHLTRRACGNKTFMNDSAFCQRYLFNRRKTPSRVDEYRMSQQRRIIEDTQVLDPLIPPSPGENEGCKNLDDVYVNLIIYTGRSRPDLNMERMDKLRILDEYVRPPENSIKINKLEELFLPNKDSSDPRKVLVVGCPGIGKTLLCKKLLRELSIKGDMLQEEARKYLHLFLFHFRNFNSEEMNSMSLQTLLSRGKYSEGKLDEEVFQFILEHPDEVLLVFDGLDELKDHQKCMEEEENHAGNGVADVMPFSALYVKLVKGKILKGATVLTTTRPYAIDSVEGLPFHRMVEILGFSTEKVKEYCSKFFHDDKKAMERVWQHVQSNLNLLYLCYIPVNCFIVCSLLEKIIELTKSSEDVTLPTTLTDIYQGALRLFIFKHHPEYQTKTLRKRDLTSDGTFSSSVEDTMLNLEVLALKGIDERRLVFESEEVQEMENCGLLNRMPDVEHAPFTYKTQYCFIHLTIQEFVAARGIAKLDPQKLQHFLSSKERDEKWHLVIQFVAGLLRDKVTDVNNIFVKNTQDALMRSSYSSNSMALLMMKCLYEVNYISSVEKAAAEFKSNNRFPIHIKLDGLSLTPVDCTAVVYFVKHIDNLEYLDVSWNPLGDGGCSEISKLIAAGGPQKLNLQDCNISDRGLVTILDAMKHETCNISQLNISRNDDITDKGYSYLCDALMDEKCNLTGLGMINVLMDKDISLKLSNALKHENCKLTMLRINTAILPGFMLTNHQKDEADEVDLFIDFCNATLVDKNCKLRILELEVDLMPRACISHIWEVIKNENCRLSTLTLLHRYVRDEVISCVCEALKNVDCKFTEFHLTSSYGRDKSDFFELSDYVTDERMSWGFEAFENTKAISIMHPGDTYITDVGVSHLCDALKHQDCKLTRLSLVGSIHETLTSKSIEDLQDAITHDNCKLEELTLCFHTKPHFDLTEFTKIEYTCIILNDNGHKFLATRGRSGQYEEIDLSSIVFDEKKYFIIKIYRHPLRSSTSVTSACNIN